MPTKSFKTSRPVLGSSFLALLLISPSLLALDEGVCYSVELASAPVSSSSDLSISNVPSHCELLNFTNMKAIRCGCYESLDKANEQLQNMLPMRKNARLAQTRKSRFKNISIPSKKTVLEENNTTRALVPEENSQSPQDKTKVIETPIIVNATVVSTSLVDKKQVIPSSKENAKIPTDTKVLVKDASDQNDSEFSDDLEGFNEEIPDIQTAIAPLIATASVTKETSAPQTATASFTKETSAPQTATASFDETDSDLDGFSEDFGDEGSDLDGFSDDEALGGFSEEPSLSEDDELDGFSDDTVSLTSEQDDKIEEKISALENLIGKSQLSGKLAFETTVGIKKHEVDGIEYSGVNQAQTSLYLQFDKKLSSDWKLRISGDAFYDAIYDIKEDNDYNDDILNAYRTQLRFDDTYIQGRLSDDIDLKAGRQIVIWGKSDNIRITDVINPTDNRLPGVTDIEYLRLPTTMAKLDWYTGDWDVSAMLITEARVSIAPPIGSEFFPVDSGLLDTAVPPSEPANTPTSTPTSTPSIIEPSSSFENLQYGLAANGVFSGWDLSFYAANVFDKDNHTQEVVAEGSTPSDFEYSKIYMLGTAFNMVEGSWLLKGEAAFLNGLKYSTTSDEKNRLDALIGLEYMGFTDTSISLELANRHIFGFEDVMENPPDGEDQNSIQTIVRVTRDFMHDTLEITALANILGPDFRQGGFARVWGEYELAEALSLDLGLVYYQGGTNAYFEAIKANDRIFADISYSF